MIDINRHNSECDKWKNRTYVNESTINQCVMPKFTYDSFSTWYHAMMKIGDFMYPVLFRDTIRRVQNINRPAMTVANNMCVIDDEHNYGEKIEPNEICVSQNVAYSMIEQGLVSGFKVKHGKVVYNSAFDNSLMKLHYDSSVDVEIIPYNFSYPIAHYFDTKDELDINSKFRLEDGNQLLTDVNLQCKKRIKLSNAFIGERGTMHTMKVTKKSSDGVHYEWYVPCYFLSFTSYGYPEYIL